MNKKLIARIVVVVVVLAALGAAIVSDRRVHENQH